MEFYISYLKDVLGNNYIGISIPNDIIKPYLDKLKEIIKDDYDLFIENKFKRDGDSYHLTVINVRDFNSLSKEMGYNEFLKSLELIFNYPIDDMEMKGIGAASKNDNLSYFIICDSEKLDAVRKRFNLRKHDFHITLGFNRKDVFGVPKNMVISNINK
jgi:hypothetical protein